MISLDKQALCDPGQESLAVLDCALMKSLGWKGPLNFNHFKYIRSFILFNLWDMNSIKLEPLKNYDKNSFVLANLTV